MVTKDKYSQMYTVKPWIYVPWIERTPTICSYFDIKSRS